MSKYTTRIGKSGRAHIVYPERKPMASFERKLSESAHLAPSTVESQHPVPVPGTLRDKINSQMEPTHSVEISLAALNSLHNHTVSLNANGNLVVSWRGHVAPSFDINFRSGTNFTEAQKTAISRAADRALILTLLQ